jgi:hypothetical protein
MPSLEKAERIGGVGLLGVPTFDFFVWALDNYARGELLMNLREQLPTWLVNPAFVFVCMCGGLGLLYLSHQRQLLRILTRPSQLVDVEQYRDKERPGWLLPLTWVALGALVAAPMLALAYSLAYKGTPPLQAHPQTPPPICKTADCFPARPKVIPVAPPTIVNAPGGIPIVGNKGTVNNPTVINQVPKLELTPTQIVVPSDQVGFVKTLITVVPNKDVTPPFNVILKFDIPPKSVGVWISGAGGISVGGPGAVSSGTDQVIPLGTGFTPKHALLLTVYSMSPIKLLDIHLE